MLYNLSQNLSSAHKKFPYDSLLEENMISESVTACSSNNACTFIQKTVNVVHKSYEALLWYFYDVPFFKLEETITDVLMVSTTNTFTKLSSL